MEQSILIVVFGLIAEICGTIAGFGSSSIFLPLVSQVIDFQNALLLVAIYHIFGNTARLSLFYKHFNKEVFFLFGVPSIILTILGATLVSYVDQNLLKAVLGVVLICFSGYSLYTPTLKVTPNKWVGILGGGLSGFTAGLIGTGGVLRGAFMSLFKLPKEQYIATIASVALLVDFTRIPIYFRSGFLDTQYLSLIPVLLAVAFIGSYIGKQIVKVLPEALFRKIILLAIIAISLILISQGVSNL